MGSPRDYIGMDGFSDSTPFEAGSRSGVRPRQGNTAGDIVNNTESTRLFDQPSTKVQQDLQRPVKSFAYPAGKSQGWYY